MTTLLFSQPPILKLAGSRLPTLAALHETFRIVNAFGKGKFSQE
ncbi:MAG: hypothetical protein ABI550_01105 [Ignavibacteriaceae bacterium]